jgi:hypothetical protein
LKAYGLMRKSDPSGLIAGIGVAIGVILMFAGIYYRLEEGSNLRTWDELRLGKRLFFAGAATALVVPVLAFVVGLRARRTSPSKKTGPLDDLR